MEKMALILSNFSSPESARSVLRILLQEKAVTSGNIYPPIFSIYPWDEKIQEDTETPVLFKTAFENKDRLIKRLRELHPYDLPPIISIESEANADFTAWLRDPNGYTSSK